VGDDGRDPPISDCGAAVRWQATLGRKLNWAAARRGEKRPAKKKSRGTAGLWEKGLRREQEQGEREVFQFLNERF
jgi:hypothetical protein